MEIKTHVLTNEQHLDDNRKAMARKNIDAAKKAVNTHEGNLAGFDANGELVDSGIANNKVIQGVSRQIEGQPAVPLTPDEHGCVTVVIPAGVDVSGKADKVSEATAGNFAGLDGFGNLTDSGKSASDFATAAQGAKADTALQEHQDISGKANKSEMDITAVTGDDTKKNIQLMEGLDQDVVVAHQDVSDKAVKSEMVITDVTGDTTKKNIQLKDGLNQDVVVEHQDISGKAEKSEMSITAVSGDDTKKTIQLKDGLSQDVVVAHQDISGKAEKNEMSITAVSGDDTKKTIQLKDGLAQDVVVAHQDISGKAEKSEMSITDVSGDATKKTIQLKDGLSQDVVIAHQDISGKEDVSNKVTSWSQPTTDANYPSEKLVKDSLDNKADKVSGANAGNLASLTANGNLADSGKRASDFVESVSINGGTAITPTDGNVDLPLAVNNSGTGTDGAMSGADKVKLDGIEPGAEVNLIESVKVDGSALTIDANKAVDIPLASATASGNETVYVTGVVTGQDKQKWDDWTSASVDIPPINGVKIGGRKYEVKKFGNRVWMMESLKYDTEVPNALYINESQGVYYYTGDYLLRGDELATIIPAGWRVPTISDRDALVAVAGGTNEDGARYLFNNFNVERSTFYDGYHSYPGGYLSDWQFCVATDGNGPIGAILIRNTTTPTLVNSNNTGGGGYDARFPVRLCRDALQGE